VGWVQSSGLAPHKLGAIPLLPRLGFCSLVESSYQGEAGGGRGGSRSCYKKLLAGSQVLAGLDPLPQGGGGVRLKKGPAWDPPPDLQNPPQQPQIPTAGRSTKTLLKWLVLSGLVPDRCFKRRGGH